LEVKAGYKQTEVGVIPEDWAVAPLGEHLQRVPSYGINAPAIQFDSRFPTYLRITDITEDGRFFEATKASVNHPASTAYFLALGDIVFARTGASVGKSYLYNPKDGHLVFAGFLIRLTPNPESLVPAFLSFFTQSRPYWSWVKANSMRSGQPGINGREYASLPVPLPPTKAEQEGIAKALSDADAHIESLEQLIVKKRRLKQGAMQELLAGRKRLSGFRGKWEWLPLEDICTKIQDGTHFSPKQGGNDFLYVTSKNIRFGTLDVSSAERISAAEHAKIVARCDVAKGDLLLTKDGANTGNAALNTLNEPFSLLSSVAMLRFNSRRHAAGYFLHQILSHSGQQQIKEQMSGNAITRLTLLKIRNLKFPIPLFAEQAAIATILTDMGSEITALETKLAKARQIKQGMMQELLTGKTRLT